MSGTQTSDSFSDFLKKGIGPRVGMWRVPLPTETYLYDAVPLVQTRLLNMFAEQEPTDARALIALRPTHGLVPASTVFGSGPVLEMNSDLPGALYALAGTHFYRVTIIAGVSTVTDLGDVGTTTGADFDYNLRPSIAVGVNAAVVCVPPHAFTCSHTGALNRIGGPVFPGAKSVAYIDGYFVFTALFRTSQWFSSALLDPTSYDALDFAFADGTPNVIYRAMTLNDEVWLLGDKSHEVWYTSGDADFPFRRRPGGIIPFGTRTIRSCVALAGSMFWVSEAGIVYQSIGYKPTRISTHAIEQLIRVATTEGIQWALGYIHDGHTFYCLTLVNLSVGIGATTIVYDTLTQKWADRASSDDGTGYWLPKCVAQIGEQLLFGDFYGVTYNPVVGGATDNGVTVMRQITLPPLWSGTNRAFCNRVEIEMQVGTLAPDNLALSWSDDGGINFTGGPRTMVTGTIGQTRQRVVTTRLGSYHQRVFRIQMNGSAVVYAFDADLTQPLAGG